MDFENSQFLLDFYLNLVRILFVFTQNYKNISLCYSRKQLLSVKFWKILFFDDVNKNMMILATFSYALFSCFPAGRASICIIFTESDLQLYFVMKK